MATVPERKAALRIRQAQDREALRKEHSNDLAYLNNTWDERVATAKANSKRELDGLRANKKTARAQLKAAQASERAALSAKQKNDLAAIK